jgi:hypothetical protein
VEDRLSIRLRFAPRPLWFVLWVVLPFMPLAAPADPLAESRDAHVTAAIPSYAAPRTIDLDGRVGKDEWRGAARFDLAGGGQALLLADSAHVYVAIQGESQGWAHVYLAGGDSVRVLHASAALGAATYRRSGKAWHRTRTFEWELRAPRGGTTPASEQDTYFERYGWVANTSTVGDRNVLEYRIARAAFEPRDAAIVLAYAMSPESPAAWPARVADESLREDLVRGDPPGRLALTPAGWGRVRFERRGDEQGD